MFMSPIQASSPILKLVPLPLLVEANMLAVMLPVILTDWLSVLTNDAVGTVELEGRVTIALLKLITPLLNPILDDVDPLTKCKELLETYILSHAAVGDPKL